MLSKILFLHHGTTIQNNPGRETITAGLGPAEQYGITLLVLIIIGIIIYIKRKKKKVD